MADRNGSLSRVSLVTLGACRLDVCDEITSGITANFYRIAVYLLLCDSNHAVSRSRLWEVLWPDVEPGKASANLRQSLTRIRQLQEIHGFRLIENNFSTVFLNLRCDIEWDLKAFLYSVRADGRQSFLDCRKYYNGDLLADIPSSSQEYEDWLSFQREHLRTLYLDKSGLAIDGAVGLSSHEVVESARHLVSIDPCNEEAYQVLMSDAVRKKNRPHLETLYRACERHLKDEFNIDVSEKTKALRRELCSGAGLLMSLLMLDCLWLPYANGF